MINNITTFIMDVSKVRAIIQENIDNHPAESFKRYPYGEVSSLRKKTADVMRYCIDDCGNVYLPDEIDPVALTRQFMNEGQYTIEGEIALAIVCRSMVTPINDLYAAAAGRKGIHVPFRMPALEGKSKRQIKNMEAQYIKKVESRKDCKMLRARLYKTHTGEKINQD